MRDLWQDLRYAARILLRQPAFTALSILTLAVGVGANSALFSVANAVLLRPFPYTEPERLVVVWETQLKQGLPFMFASPPNYRDWRERQTVFEEMASFTARSFFLAQNDEQFRVQGASVTAGLFPLLGVTPFLGRTISTEDERPGANKVVLVGYGLWQQTFGGDPGVIGTTISINEQPHTVIGVMAPDLNFPPPIDLEGNTLPQRNELWIPFDSGPVMQQRGAHFMTVIARLKPGLSIQRASDEMASIARRLEEQFPTSNAGWEITLVPFSKQVLGNVETALIVLLSTVGLVLLIACLNIANMMLARAAARQKEFAIRTALGASRWRLARQLLTESLLLAVTAALAGLLLAQLGIRLIISVAPKSVPRLDESTVDLRVVVFTLLISLVAGTLFGLAPALRSVSRKMYESLKEGGRLASESGGTLRLRNALVVAEVALSLTLLVGAGLLLQSFLRLRKVDAGFRTEDILTLQVRLPQARFQQQAQRAAISRGLQQGLSSLPQVESVGLGSNIPIGSDWQGSSLTIEGEPPLRPEERRQVNIIFVTPGYFRTLGVPIVGGRDFSDEDGEGVPGVALINETLARRYFPNQDPIGKRIFTGFHDQVPRLIVGIVKDIKQSSLQAETTPHVYLAYYQVSQTGYLSLVVRGSVGPATLLSAVRDRVRSIDRGITIYEVKTLNDVVAESIALPRFSMLLSSLFGATALLLTVVGIYGVVSYTVTQQTREIGIRMALGAEAGEILRWVLGKGMRPTMAGIVLGLAAAFALTRFVSAMLFGVKETDLFTFGSIAVLLAVVALIACYIPARRATRVDPMVVLRCE